MRYNCCTVRDEHTLLGGHGKFVVCVHVQKCWCLTRSTIHSRDLFAQLVPQMCSLYGPFPEQAALFLNPFKEEKEMRNIHPLNPQRRPAEAAKALAASSKLVERADDKTAVAFAATSLPARYATIFRILEELKFKDKHWKPTTLLDYASGPGCGMWASMQVSRNNN